MAFDDFLSKVKVTSQQTFDKAKDSTKRMVSVNDLKSQIRGLNNEKNKLFTQMGMDVYLSKKEEKDISEAINEYVSSIDSIDKKISKLREKLALIETEC